MAWIVIKLLVVRLLSGCEILKYHLLPPCSQSAWSGARGVKKEQGIKSKDNGNTNSDMEQIFGSHRYVLEREQTNKQNSPPF